MEKVSEKKELNVIIEPFNDMSIIESCQSLNRFVKKYQEQIDVAIAELYSPLADVINSAIKQKGYPLSLNDVGHLSLLLNYIHNKRGIEIYYVGIDGYQDLLKDIRGEMASKNMKNLYQICMGKNQKQVEYALTRAGFNII